jgi:flagellar protein FliO/FliZ
MPNGLSSLLWFIAIVAMIPLSLWLLKRTSIGGAAAHGVMRSVAALPISANQRIVTVEVGHGEDRRWLVLGVTPNAITTLHTMAPQAEGNALAGSWTSAGAAQAPGSVQGLRGAIPQAFAPVLAQVLARLRRDKGSAA